MRMLILSLVLIAPAIAGAAALDTKPTTIKPICRNPTTQRVEGTGRNGIHPLTAEPPAKEIKAVVRTVDGCNKPVVVSEKVGTPKR